LTVPPIVSVVVIFRDEVRFLKDAVASVLAQAWDSWELLMVDDGSTDGSTEIARRYAAEMPDRVRYLEHPRHENRGMSRSRNVGLREAAGTYVAYLDADDTWRPAALAEQVQILQAHPDAAMVYGPIEYWFGWTGAPDDAARDYIEPLGVPADTLLAPPGPIPLFLRDRAAVPSGLMVRRDAALAVEGFEDAFRGEYEDQAFLAKLCLRFPVFAAHRCWYRYRQHAGSAVAMGIRTGATEAARLAYLRWLVKYLASRRPRARSQPVWWASHVELWRFTHPRAYHLVRHAEALAARLRGRRRGGRR
jgi:glycosyltransferase involved in cell wall biosynthesis